VRVDDLGVFRHHLADLLGNLAHLHRIGADHAELHGEADRRTEHEAVNPGPRFRQDPISKSFFEPRLDALASLQVLGDDDDLSEIRVWQHRIEPKPKARRALADIGGVGDDVGIAGKQALGLLSGVVGNADRRAFREPHLKEQFGSGRGRKELLLHQAETSDGREEHDNRGGNDGLAPAQGTLDQAAERAVDAGVVERIGIVVSPVLGEIRQKLQAEIGREHHRDDPGGNQREADDPENAAGIFA
jgi:hypothetical protein